MTLRSWRALSRAASSALARSVSSRTIAETPDTEPSAERIGDTAIEIGTVSPVRRRMSLWT